MRPDRIACLLLAATVLSAHCSGREERARAGTRHPAMRIARNYWPGQYWIEVAAERKWFEEEGLDVALVDTNADYFGSLGDVPKGTLDVNSFSLFDVVRFNTGGADLVAVFSGDYTIGTDAIFAREGSIRDLRGKRLGLATNTYLEYVADGALRSAGLTLDDVTLVHVQPEQAAEAFVSGRVDAVATWQPFASEVKRAGGRRIFDTSQMPGIMPDVFAFRRNFIERRPADVQKFVRVWHRTTESLKSDRAGFMAAVARANGKTVAEVEQLTAGDRILDLRENRIAFTYAGGLDSLHGAAQEMNRFLIARGLAASRLDTTRFLDDRFLRGLE